MRKIKVLHMPVTNSGSGVSQYILENWRFIDKDKFCFDFVTRSKSLDFFDELIPYGSKIHYLSCSADENEPQFIKEMNTILDEGYDVIHLHTSFWKGFLVEILAIEKGVPKIIVHSHSTMIDILDEHLRNEAIKNHNYYKGKFALEHATDFVACSNAAAEWLFGEQIPKSQIRVLNNAIDLSKYSYSVSSREKYRKLLGLNNSFVLGHIGRFVYQKNHEFLIEVFKEVHKKVQNAKLVLIGTGVLEESIKQKIKNYGLCDAVLFLGKRNDISEILNAFDLFILPSLFEGLPLVLIEAQASGIKSLVSENVTTEVKITPYVDFIPLNISEWVDLIERYSIGYEREKTDSLIKKAGYDLKDQIKVLEQLYLN